MADDDDRDMSSMALSLFFVSCRDSDAVVGAAIAVTVAASNAALAGPAGIQAEVTAKSSDASRGGRAVSVERCCLPCAVAVARPSETTRCTASRGCEGKKLLISCSAEVTRLMPRRWW